MLLKVAGQEVLTADGVGVRASVVVRYAVTDPLRWTLAHDGERSAAEWLYLAAQLAVRDFVGGMSAEERLAARSSAGEVLIPRVRDAAEQVGAVLEAVDLRDVSFPGDLRRTLALVAAARQEAIASLERAAESQQPCARWRTRLACWKETLHCESCAPCWQSSAREERSC